MARLVRATQHYWAGDAHVPEGTIMHEGDKRIVELYVEEFGLPEAPPAPEPKAAKGKAKES